MNLLLTVCVLLFMAAATYSLFGGKQRRINAMEDRIAWLESELAERNKSLEASWEALSNSDNALQTETNNAVEKVRTARKDANDKIDRLRSNHNAEVRAFQREIAKLQSERDHLADKVCGLAHDADELARRQELALASLQGKAREVAPEASNGACGGPASPAESVRPTAADMQYADQASPPPANPNPRYAEAEARARLDQAAGLVESPIGSMLRAYADKKARTFAATDAGAARLGRPSLAEMLTRNLEAAGVIQEFFTAHGVR